MVRGVAGRVAGSEAPPPHGDLAPLSERQVLELEPGVLGGADLGAHLRLELPGARHEVVVDVGLERVRDADVQLLGAFQVLGDVPQRVNGDRLPAVRVRDEERGVPQLRCPEEIDPRPRRGAVAPADGWRGGWSTHR